ncbi:MAG: aminotransferase class I/II-fold pyridoxal phosphate-dependent enzyme [Lachnospiraceae bacterium]|nr:aminotransferase class I/II-fold pyridoxal phosphate-dependent enzyme [Lachnospiraceae bacterium]
MAHGGDIYTNDIKMDFSVNVNPHGVPEGLRDIFSDIYSDFVLYPDYESTELRRKLAEYYNLDINKVLCGNGASEIFMAIAHAIRPKKVLNISPSFAGYVWAFEAIDTELIYYITDEKDGFLVKEDLLDIVEKRNDIDMIIFANPSNPVGNYIDNDLIDNLLIKCREKEIVVIIDECFMELSVVSHNKKTDMIMNFDNLFIVRAFTKTFAIPALRLGYVLGSNDNLMMKIRRQLPEWNVSLPAQKAGSMILSMDLIDYLEESVKIIKEELSFLSSEFRNLGIKTYQSFTNFILIKTDIPLYDKLLDKGILIRDCSDFIGLKKGYYRIAVKSHKENIILIDTIKEIMR